MIVRTEFSFRIAYGRIERVMDCCPRGGIIADNGAWGHVPWAKEAQKRGVPRGLGATLRVGDPKNWREVVLVPLSALGLRDLYSRLQAAAAGPLAPGEIGPGDWTMILAPGRRGKPPLAPAGALVPFCPGHLRGTAVAFSDNRYPTPEDARPWAFSLGALARPGSAPAHIMSPAELRAAGASQAAIDATVQLLERASAVALPTAQNIRFPVADALAELGAMTRAELTRRQLARPYAERLERELALIAEKKFADYFLVIAEMISWAKARMLVGPGRGSSAGSIVCWLLRITEVDPLRHGLLFERFIDTNRADLPDIDIDFPDEARESVLQHLADLYGAQNVAHIGTVMRYKGKSALTDVGKELKIPPWELDAFKDVIIERSSGDSRANECLRDTLEGMDAGKALLAKYPELAVACDLEGGARQSGKHAAGMIVCNEPVDHFCAIGPNRVAQIDKKMAEALNILKIDALGLRTLSVLETACKVAGMDHNDLYAMPLNDADAIDIFNQRRWSGIFQFEGHSVQSLSNQITFRRFEDISALTALARPGPLGGGEAGRWMARHEGREEIVPAHPLLGALTKETFGVILFQEQVMAVARDVGQFSWADTSAIRKVMSDRQGDEAFRKYEKLFLKGAMKNGLEKDDAIKLWKTICTYGSWGFNKSHAVAYGTVSYWCVAGNTPIYDWDRKCYLSVAKAFKVGVNRIACYDEKTGRTIPGKVKVIVRTTGEKNKNLKLSWKLFTKSNKGLLCSEDHKLLTPRGYKRLKNLMVGDLVASERRTKVVSVKERRQLAAAVKAAWTSLNAKQKRQRIKRCFGKLTKDIRRLAGQKGWAAMPPLRRAKRLAALIESAEGGTWTARARGLVAGCGHRYASSNEMFICAWLNDRGIKHESQVWVGKGFADWRVKGVYVEFDGVNRPESYFERKYKDDAYIVIKSLSEVEEKLAFAMEEELLRAGGTVTFEPIKSIQRDRPRVMYDISMVSAPHNFLANGIVVHNCAWMKAHHPLAFAAGCLRHAKDTDSALLQLRELAREGIPYTAFDPARSGIDWEVQDGKLLGGLLGIPGIGQRKALEILNRRTNGMGLTPGLSKLLSRQSIFADIFPTRTRFKDIYSHPDRHNLSNPSALQEIHAIEPPCDVYIIGRLVKKNLRDLNEERFLVRRGGVRFTERMKMLVLHLEDDSGRIIGIIGRDDYERIGAKIVESGVVGETWLMLRGWVNDAKFLNIRAVRWLE